MKTAAILSVILFLAGQAAPVPADEQIVQVGDAAKRAKSVWSSNAGASWKRRDVRAVPDITKSADDPNKFGGAAGTRKGSGVGFFRVSHQDEPWWLVDPEGCLFFSMGVNSVDPTRISSDGISVNYYHRWEPEKERLADWTKWSGRPFLVSEFYAMKVTDEKTDAAGAGFRVLQYADAGQFYQTFTVGLLWDIPNCVGWRWFKYADDSADWHKGIVERDGEAHRTLVEAMGFVNRRAYSLRGLRGDGSECQCPP